MAEDLTVRVISASDEPIVDQVTGRVKTVTRVTFKLGLLGPFREDFDEGTFTEWALRERTDKRAAALRSFT